MSATIQTLPTLATSELMMRVGLAIGCGALVGLEREWRDRAAGLRTHMLVCLGSTMFTLLSLYGMRAWVLYSVSAPGTRALYTADPGRIAAQIVSGIGFIGAGAIWRSRSSVHGVTTAASLWIMAAIGMAIGMGWYIPAIMTTSSVLLVLVFVRVVSHRVRGAGADNDVMEMVVHVRISSSSIAGLVADQLAHIGMPPVRTTLSQRQVGDERRLERGLTCVIEHPPKNATSLVIAAISSLEQNGQSVIGLDVELR